MQVGKPTRKDYSLARWAKNPPVRLVVMMPKAELARIDSWGLSTGRASRTDAVRVLINHSLRNLDVSPLSTENADKA